MRYINLRYSYLLTYLLIGDGKGGEEEEGRSVAASNIYMSPPMLVCSNVFSEHVVRST